MQRPASLRRYAGSPSSANAHRERSVRIPRGQGCVIAAHARLGTRDGSRHLRSPVPPLPLLLHRLDLRGQRRADRDCHPGESFQFSSTEIVDTTRPGPRLIPGSLLVMPGLDSCHSADLSRLSVPSRLDYSRPSLPAHDGVSVVTDSESQPLTRGGHNHLKRDSPLFASAT
jgi:hypothetical protein